MDKSKWTDKNGQQKQVYKGVVITKLDNGKYTWGFGARTLKECKRDIDKELNGKGGENE